jgi:hypothetical protein
MKEKKLVRVDFKTGKIIEQVKETKKEYTVGAILTGLYWTRKLLDTHYHFADIGKKV